MWKNRGLVLLGLIIILTSMTVQAVFIPPHETVLTGIELNTAVGNVVLKNDQVNAITNIIETPANKTIYFEISGKEVAQGSYQFTVTPYGNGTLNLTFHCILPVQVVNSAATASYNSAKSQELLTYTINQPSLLNLVFAQIPANAEPGGKAVLFLDDFLYSNPLPRDPWTIDLYQSPQTSPGEYVTNGFLALQAKTTSSLETVHVNRPSYSPSFAYPDNVQVKRKMTVSLYPFQKKESNTAEVLTGLTPLYSSGAYPGGTPNNTPIVDQTCPAIETGANYIHVRNDGQVFAFSCGDGASVNQLITTLSDPTLYTVLTIETSAVTCASCTDSQQSGHSWAWYRVYQENTAGTIINDQNVNITTTSAVTPLFQNNYIFVSQSNNNGAATAQLSYIDLVQLQNYGSPVCLFGCIPPTIDITLITNPFANFWSGLVILANWLGQGDLGFGSMILFSIMAGGTVSITYVFSRNTLLVSMGFLTILGIFMSAGLMGSIWIFLVIIGLAFLSYSIVKKMFFSGGSAMAEEVE